MAEFATEENVRLHAQIADTAIASAELVDACITEAHERILTNLNETIDTESPPATLVQGEILLAAAILLRAVASRDAVDQLEVQIGGQRVDAGQRFAALMAMARKFEKEATGLLAPHGVLPAATAPGVASETTPVLGD